MKKTLFTALLFVVLKAYSQTDITANMTGRWEINRKNYKADMLFVNNGKIAFLSTEGMLFGYILYTWEVKDGVIKLKYTSDIDRKKHKQYQYCEMKFLNDSTMLHSYHKIPAGADTNTKNVGIYRKLKQPKPNTALRLPNYHDFAGSWVSPFNGEITGIRMIFVDEEHVIFRKDSIDEHLTYKIDFTKQPSPIDFYHPLIGKTEHAFLQFGTTHNFRLEWFYGNDRGDHFTALGNNMDYVRESYYNSYAKK
jgi:hypothetical protein